MELTRQKLMIENTRRLEELNRATYRDYNPSTGEGCYGRRVRVKTPYSGAELQYIPAGMWRDPEMSRVNGSRSGWEKLRCRYDFEYWAWRCCAIKPKNGNRLEPFVLNYPQRKVLSVLEEERLAGRPIRVIILKARQWGCTTLIQHYMAWLQCVVTDYSNSIVVAHRQPIATSIRGMLDQLLERYPEELWEGEGKRGLKPYQGSPSVRCIGGRHCTVTIGTAESPDACRGQDYAFAHLSEVAFWADSKRRDPCDLMRSIIGSVAEAPMTMVVLESTANGVGNFFHDEWLRNAEGGGGGMRRVFVPWWEIEYDVTGRIPPAEAKKLYESMDRYERGTLWGELQLPLERIAWWRRKRQQLSSLRHMLSEYPATSEEAFANTDTNVFDTESVERLRGGCREPEERGDVVSVSGAVTGMESLRGVHFAGATNGALKVWEKPRAHGRYVVAIDVGGRWEGSDYSVIAVIKAPGAVEGKPEVVAQWRGHIDTDLLVWRSAMIGMYYNCGRLVFESNTLEGDDRSDGVDPHGAYLLNVLRPHYPNLYYRMPTTSGGRGLPGFHTNRGSKQMIIDEMVGMVRDGGYEERDQEAVNELTWYERTPSGSYGARKGKHDDILMTRAIGLHALRELMEEDPRGFDPGDDDTLGYLERGREEDG